MNIHSTTKRLYFLPILLGILFGFKGANASHYAAVDLYVEYIGTGPSDLTYRITLMTYKACEPNNASLGSEQINWASVNANYTSSSGFLNAPNDTLDQLCPNFKPVNSCRVPTSIYPGFVRKIFRHTMTLPSRQTDWRFWWTSGARNGGIMNLQNPTGNIYVEAGLNNVIRYDNNTPQFLVDPLPYLCQNQPASYLNGPFDLNGDSLETINHAPYNTATVQYTYAPGYSFANPIATTAANPYTVNKYTGTATFTPQNTGLFVLAFRCNKYDKKTGQLIGYIMRDVQVSVLNCNSAAPEFDKTPQNTVKASGVVNQDGSTTVTVCTGQEAQFSFSAKSQTASNNVYIEANNANIPGSTVSIANDGTSQPTATFIWTPHYGNIGDHILKITAKEST